MHIGTLAGRSSSSNFDTFVLGKPYLYLYMLFGTFGYGNLNYALKLDAMKLETNDAFELKEIMQSFVKLLLVFELSNSVQCVFVYLCLIVTMCSDPIQI